jgi:hypothetical protein
MPIGMKRLTAFAGLTVVLVLPCMPSRAAELRPLAGGVTFRTDDNGSPDYWRHRMAVFAKHGLHFGAAVNLLAAESQPGMMAVLKELQAQGHDFMDHTPSHNNLSLTCAQADDLAWSAGRPGVDHLAEKTVHLRYTNIVPPATRESRRVSVVGNRLTPLVADGAERWFKDVEYLYFPELKAIYRYNHRQAVNGVYHLLTPWLEDTVDVQPLADTPVQRLQGHEIQPTPEGLVLLAETVRRVCDRHGLTYPVTYAAPGNSPHLTRSAVKAVYGARFGYKSAAVYPEAAARVFNEPDPAGDAAFAMQWGDAGDDTQDLPALKKRIADLLASNKVVIIGSHVLNNPVTWPAYFEKMDALLVWLKVNQIPVRSHAAWAETLYRSGTRLIGNCFPPLDRDLDGDGKPDGYELVNATPVAVPVDVQLPEGRMMTANKPGTLCRVQGLGGLPHGPAELACWINGPAGTTVQVMVHGVGALTFPLKDGWQRYTAPIVVPDAVATARVDLSWSAKQGGVIAVCGLGLAGKEKDGR